jgi:hypothetical protein
MNAKAKHPVARRREALQGHPIALGAAAQNLWLLYDILERRDVVVHGDLRMELFFACEGDPSVLRADYSAEPLPIYENGEPRDACFHAIVTTSSRTTEARVVDPYASGMPEEQKFRLQRAAAGIGAELVLVTASDLEQWRQRIQNWQRAVAAVRRCSSYPIELHEAEVANAIRRAAGCTIDTVLRQFPSTSAAVVLASTVRLLRQRRASSDLDSHPWGRHTALRWELAS